MNRWPLNKAWFWETAPFFRLLLPFAAGILFYDAAHPGSVAGFITVIVVAVVLFAVIVLQRKGDTLYQALAFILLGCILFCSGATVSYLSDVRNDRAWFGRAMDSHASYLARVTDAPLEKENSWKLRVSVINTIKDGKVSRADGDAFLYCYKDMPMLLHKGDSILIPGNWQPITNTGNPFEFDYAAWCRRSNILFRQVLSYNDLRLFSTNDPAHAPFIERAHDWCMTQLETYLPDPKTKGLIQAMLLGDEVHLDEDLLRSYADTGIVHIIAISGGNVAIFFIVISYLLWWLRHKKHRWIKYAVALPLVWFYVLMAGAPPSAIRAAIMFSLLAFGVMLQKNNNSLNQLFATAFVLLCAQPVWLFSVGFQLSFVAVLSLVLFYRPVYKWLSPVNKAAKRLWEAVAASIAAEILVAPLVIWYFHTFPLLFVVANVVAYLFMSIVLVLGIGIIALSFIPVVAGFIGICTIRIVTVFDGMVVWLQGLNPASFHFLVLTGAELVLVYIIIAGIALFLLHKNKPMLFTSLGACCILLLMMCHDEWLSLRQLRVVAYNTGKAAHAELITGKSYCILATDTSRSKQIGFTTQPAHTYWHAWQQKEATQNELLYVDGKSILLLNRDISTNDHFPVDYLIINKIRDPDAIALQKIFSPRLMIIGNNFGRWQQDAFVQDCKDNSIRVFELSKDGAFVVE